MHWRISNRAFTQEEIKRLKENQLALIILWLAAEVALGGCMSLEAMLVLWLVRWLLLAAHGYLLLWTVALGSSKDLGSCRVWSFG
ncbi:hypothetical protein U1Q18_045244 [Sarracenia purpurea var. burkii]